MKAIAVVFVLMIGLAGCSKRELSYDELTGPAKMDYLRAQADQAIKTDCTNHVPGIRNFVAVNAYVSSNSLAEWHGVAQFDYLNAAGGIDRTNLLFIFKSSSSGHLYCELDVHLQNVLNRARQ